MGRFTDISLIPTVDEVDECLVWVGSLPEAPRTGVDEPLDWNCKYYFKLLLLSKTKISIILLI